MYVHGYSIGQGRVRQPLDRYAAEEEIRALSA